MAKNGWTKKDLIELERYNNDSNYEVTCKGDLIHLCILSTTSPGFDLWCTGPETWKTINDQVSAFDASPTFIYDDDRFSRIYELEDYKKEDFAVEQVIRTKINWQNPTQVTIEEVK